MRQGVMRHLLRLDVHSSAEKYLIGWQARRIYKLRPDSPVTGQEGGQGAVSLGGTAQKVAVALADAYQVDSKTIRDIWNRKSWVQATQSLWTDRERNM